MVRLSLGQVEAARWAGLAPFWWGWVVLALFVVLVLIVLLVRRPMLTLPRASGLADDPSVLRMWSAAIMVGALLLYAPGLFGTFNIIDDYSQIMYDATITELTPAHLWATTLGSYKGTNQEVMYLSFQLNWLVAGKVYWGWYLVNLALLPVLMWLTSRLAYLVTGDRVAGLVAMACLACTPQMAEMMCWMSVRSHYFGLIFAVASSVAYLEYLAGRGRRRWLWLGLAFAAFVLTQFSKPVFAYIPLWWALFDIYKGRSSWLWAIAEKLLGLGISAAFMYKIVVVGVGGRLIPRRPLGGSLSNTIYQDFNLLVEYGRTLFVPVETGLLPAYNEALGPLFVKGDPQVLVNGFAPVASLGILLAVLAIAVILRVRFRWGLPLLWLFASGLTMATVMNIPARGYGATFEYRYAMSAHVMTAVLMGGVIATLLRSRVMSSRLFRSVPMLLCAAYLTWGAVVTNENREAWRTPYNLYIRGAELYPRAFDPQHLGGMMAQRKGDHYQAIQYFLASEKYNDRRSKVYRRRLGDSLYHIGDHDGAKKQWSKYFRRHHKDVKGRYLKRFKEVGMVPNDVGMREWPE